jgi:fermentation-respiration switch protein FrsA (DUF1100 family)
MLYWLLIATLGTYFLVVLVCFVFQRRYIYQTHGSLNAAAVSLTSIADSTFVSIQTEDGQNIEAWYTPPRDNRYIVIFFHGSADSPDHRATRFLALTTDGFGVIAPYFRGFGRSTGSPTEAGLLLDAKAVYSYCSTLYPPERIALWGFSLGSAVAVLLAAKVKVAALILEAPFTSLAAIAKYSVPFIPMGLILRDEYRADLAIASVAAPILMLHGEADREAPVSLGELLFEAASQPKEFVRFSAGAHANLDRYGALAVVRRFLASLPLNAAPLPPPEP